MKYARFFGAMGCLAAFWGVPAAALPDHVRCVFAYYQSNDPRAATFRAYAQSRLDYQLGAFPGSRTVLIPWDKTGPMPSFAGAMAARNCEDVYVIYDGHGPINEEVYPRVVRDARRTFPGYKRLHVEDSSCLSMQNPLLVAARMRESSLRPVGDQFHSFLGNQLCTAGGETEEAATLSWYGINLRSNAPTSHFVFDCHSRNQCDAETVGNGFWCRDEDRTIFAQCHALPRRILDFGQRYAWRDAADARPFPGNVDEQIEKKVLARGGLAGARH